MSGIYLSKSIIVSTSVKATTEEIDKALQNFMIAKNILGHTTYIRIRNAIGILESLGVMNSNIYATFKWYNEANDYGEAYLDRADMLMERVLRNGTVALVGATNSESGLIVFNNLVYKSYDGYYTRTLV